MAVERRTRSPEQEASWERALGFAAVVVVGGIVLSSSVVAVSYPLVVGAFFTAALLVAVAGFRRGADADPFAGPIALKLGILAVTILLQPSLVGRDPHFEIAVTQRLIEDGTWFPGLGFASHKASGYAHYPGLSFVAATFSMLSGVEPTLLARVLPPGLAVLGLVLLIAIARMFTDDDRLALGVGLAWACFSLTNVFQAQYVHEALGFPLFLAGAFLVIRAPSMGDAGLWAPFILVAGALVFTHHLSSLSLIVFLALASLASIWQARRSSKPLDVAKLGVTGAVAVGAGLYGWTFGNPEVFGYLSSMVDTVGSLVVEHLPGVEGEAVAGSNDPYVREAVVYERRGRDVFLFVARALFLAALWVLAAGNLAWRKLSGTLDPKRATLALWAAGLTMLASGQVLFNVTVGLDISRLLPWIFVFLVILAADVPTGRGSGETLRGWASTLGRRWAWCTGKLPRPQTLVSLVLVVLVAFAGFQLLTLPPYLIADDREPAYYRGQVRMVYHEDEQAMAGWIKEELAGEGEIYSDMTTHELVGPIEGGELNNTRPGIYGGETRPADFSYVTWREEMARGLLSWNEHYQRVFFPVPETQERIFQTSPSYAKIHTTARTAVYAHGT